MALMLPPVAEKCPLWTSETIESKNDFETVLRNAIQMYWPAGAVKSLVSTDLMARILCECYPCEVTVARLTGVHNIGNQIAAFPWGPYDGAILFESGDLKITKALVQSRVIRPWSTVILVCSLNVPDRITLLMTDQDLYRLVLLSVANKIEVQGHTLAIAVFLVAASQLTASQKVCEDT